MFAIKNSKRRIALIDDEPPDKKLISDGDLLIKELYVKQSNTKLDLKEQLQHTKQFERSTEFVPLTNYTAGASTLHDFENVVYQSNEIESLKAIGLTNSEIKLFWDSKKGDDYLYETHRNLEKSLLQQKLKSIKQKIATVCKKREIQEDQRNTISRRHKSEFALSVKPNSTETKLLQFALNNKKQNDVTLPHPMDHIKEIEEARFGIAEQVNVNKIRKKARNWRNKIAKIGNSVQEIKPPGKICFTAKTKWDVKESETNETVKQYTCKQQRLYTVRNGEIVEINSQNLTENSNKTLQRISIEEIKNKFKNYEEGEPTKVLFLKNLHKQVTDMDLTELISNFTKTNFHVRVLTGKMKGQAFVTFDEIETTKEILPQINGLILHTKPIVAVFGKKRT